MFLTFLVQTLKVIKTASSCAIFSLPSHHFVCSPIETLAFPSEYLCLHGLTIKRGSLCFHFLSDSGNPDQRLWLVSSGCPTITYVPLLPVINDYIRFGNEDILSCQESSYSPYPLCFHDNGVHNETKKNKYMKSPNWTLYSLYDWTWYTCINSINSIVLCCEHSALTHDYISTSLQQGVRLSSGTVWPINFIRYKA